MPRSQLRLAILTVMGVLLLGACNGFKLFQSTDDKTITTSIQAKLFSDPVLKTRDVRVDSRNGIVTLSGTVGTDLEKAAVERIAAQEDGVKKVVNLLGVASASAPPAPEGAQTAENAAPPQEVAPPPTPPAQPAPEKRSHRRHAQPASHEDNASAAVARLYRLRSPGGRHQPRARPGPHSNSCCRYAHACCTAASGRSAGRASAPSSGAHARPQAARASDDP